MSFPTINIRISGVSVSGDIDAGVMPVKIQPSNSDQIGYAEFALQNAGGVYSNVKNSGSPTVEIDINGITKFRGYIERIDPSISVNGSMVVCQCYDKGQELLNMISPDARQPPPTQGGILTSGDQGVAAPDGIDLVGVVSGVNALSGATVASFMAQFFGTETDPSGSFSGTQKSFKPHISGYTYDTWYKPDGSPDNNVNYWILHNTAKIRREYAWDTLRRLTRGALAVDSAGKFVALESYIGMSGDIHIFTSGSSEFLASGAGGQLTLIYYEAGKSGSENNNVISAVIPHDTTTVKNRLMGWFPKWSRLPVDGDSFTDLFAYSGSRWSGVVAGADVVSLSGFLPSKSGIGQISIMAFASGSNTQNKVSLIGTVRSGTLNIARYVGFGSPVGLEYDLFNWDNGGALFILGSRRRHVRIIDINNNFIIKSGPTTTIVTDSTAYTFSGFGHYTETIFKADGTFNSGNGQNGGWITNSGLSVSTTLGVSGADLSQVKMIEIGVNYNPGAAVGAPTQKAIALDNLFFSFDYQFSPVVAFNSGSQGMYKRRYEILNDYPYSVSDIQASGIMHAELQSRMGSKQVGEAQVKDYNMQMNINNGQVIRIDAPTLNTGSGLKFDYWRVIAIDHSYSTTNGFITNLRFVPWYSGNLVDPNNNLIDYTVPLRALPRGQGPGIPANLWLMARSWANSRVSLIPTDGA